MSSQYYPKFMPFDKVHYVGEKLHSQLKNKLGEVVSAVSGANGAYCVDFGDDAFIISENSLKRFKPVSKDEKEPEVVRRRRHLEDDEE